MSYADRFPAVISLGRVRSDLIGTVITGDPPIWKVMLRDAFTHVHCLGRLTFMQCNQISVNRSMMIIYEFCGTGRSDGVRAVHGPFRSSQGLSKTSCTDLQ